jgi:hypothetical protein
MTSASPALEKRAGEGTRERTGRDGSLRVRESGARGKYIVLLADWLSAARKSGVRREGFAADTERAGLVVQKNVLQPKREVGRPRPHESSC